jgi:hypothetical protein
MGSDPRFGSFMGPFANGPKVNGQDVWKMFTLSDKGGTISFDFLRMDTWDGESFKVFANDVAIISSTFGWDTNVTQTRTGTANGYNWTIIPVNNYVKDIAGWKFSQSFRVTITVPRGVGSLKLGFGSTLDQQVADESYGIDNVSVVASSVIYDNNFENNAAGFTTQWRDAGFGSQGGYVGRFGYRTGTSLNVGNGTSYGLNQNKDTTIMYDYLRIDDWHGQVMHFGVALNYLMSFVVASGMGIAAIYYWMNKFVLTDSRYYVDAAQLKKGKESKPKLSIGESIKYLFSSKYLGYIALLVLGYGMTINLIEVTWKAQVKMAYPDSMSYAGFMGDLYFYVGILTIGILFATKGVVQRFGWATGAMATPIMILITGALFFAFVSKALCRF